MRVLVCGGRDYGEIPHGCPFDQIGPRSQKANREAFLIRETLDHLVSENKVAAIISGGARGADRHAAVYARRRGIEAVIFRAEWKTHGTKAGPIRNQRMIDEGKPDLVVAFPGGKGTADMVRRAKAAGITVKEIS
jgi:hypothetical protein